MSRSSRRLSTSAAFTAGCGADSPARTAPPQVHRQPPAGRAQALDVGGVDEVAAMHTQETGRRPAFLQIGQRDPDQMPGGAREA